MLSINQNKTLKSLEQSNNETDKKVTLKDLCAEDKAKIGELLKKLAEEKEEKENLKSKYENEKKEYESKIDSMIKESQSVRIALLYRGC